MSQSVTSSTTEMAMVDQLETVTRCAAVLP